METPPSGSRFARHVEGLRHRPADADCAAIRGVTGSKETFPVAYPLLDQATMTLDEARRILDLDPDADPALHQEELLERREKLVRLMNSAPDTVHADRFRRELAEHDE